MKNLLILATMLLTFGFANAQCKIYSTDKYGDYATKVGKFEGGVIYSTDKYGDYATKVGKIVDGVIYSTDKYGDYARKVGKTEGGGSMCGAAAILLLL